MGDGPAERSVYVHLRRRVGSRTIFLSSLGGQVYHNIPFHLRGGEVRSSTIFLSTSRGEVRSNNIFLSTSGGEVR